MSATDNTWQGHYLRLEDFISKNEEICITPDYTRIPKNIREEFYTYFDAVRKAFIKENMPDLLSDAIILRDNIDYEEQGAIKLLNLEAVEYNPVLQWLLNDPQGFMLREIFDPLFGLLKRKHEIGEFGQIAKHNVISLVKDIFPRGFEKWIELSLLQLFKADKMFQFEECEVPLADAHRAGGNVIEEIPLPVESSHLIFRSEPERAFALPSFTIHSAFLERYVSVRSDIQNAMAIANNVDERNEWIRFDLAGHIMEALKKPGITLVYVASEPGDIALIADQKKIKRPDMILVCSVFNDLSEDNLETLMLLRNNLKPKIGSFLISKHNVSEKIHKALISAEESENEVCTSPIKILITDYRKEGLVPILNALQQWAVDTASG